MTLILAVSSGIHCTTMYKCQRSNKHSDRSERDEKNRSENYFMILGQESKVPVFLPYRTFYYLALLLSTTMLSLSTTTLLGVDITPQSLYGSK